METSLEMLLYKFWLIWLAGCPWKVFTSHSFKWSHVDFRHLLPVTATFISLLNVSTPLTVSLTKHWYVPLCEESRKLPVRVPSAPSLLLPNPNSPSGIFVLLWSQIHFKLSPVAPHGRMSAFSFRNFTCSELIKSWARNLVIIGGWRFDCSWPGTTSLKRDWAWLIYTKWRYKAREMKL